MHRNLYGLLKFKKITQFRKSRIFAFVVNFSVSRHRCYCQWANLAWFGLFTYISYFLLTQVTRILDSRQARGGHGPLRACPWIRHCPYEWTIDSIAHSRQLRNEDSTVNTVSSRSLLCLAHTFKLFNSAPFSVVPLLKWPTQGPWRKRSQVVQRSSI